jgi:hypothetical protein
VVAARCAFLAPRAFYARTSESLYRNAVLMGIDNRQRLGAGADLGWTFGRDTQVRAGYDAAYVSNVTRVGEPLPGSTGGEQAARVGFDHDARDRAYFASRGVRVTAQAVWLRRSPDAAGGFGWADARLSAARRIARRHVVTLLADGGASIGGAPPLPYQFSLGGPFRLGALPPDAIRGPRFVLAGAGYRTSLGRLPSLLGDRLYLTGLLEVGSAFDRWRDAKLSTSFTGGLAADTFFGPVFVGASVGNSGAARVCFVVGTGIR